MDFSTAGLFTLGLFSLCRFFYLPHHHFVRSLEKKPLSALKFLSDRGIAALVKLSVLVTQTLEDEQNPLSCQTKRRRTSKDKVKF